jgi:hypothetical protein
MSKYRVLSGAFVVFCAFSLAVPPAGASQGRGQGPAKKAEKAEKHENKSEKKADKRDDKRDDKKGDTTRVIVVDRDGHHRVIREYAVAGSLPPGLAKRDALPPGLRNQLRERGALPPGLQKRLVPVPAPLVGRLPAIPSYYHRYFIGDDLIVIDTRTNRIVTIIRDVWR